MIKIENTKVVGFEEAIRGMRNPLNSWEKSDSGFATDSECCLYKTISGDTIDHHAEGLHLIDPGYFKDPDDLGFFIGQNDKDLMKRLAKSGTDHAKYRRMIVVYADLTAPLYWWKEFDTYKVGTVANSCSTMHKIQAKEFTLDDFSHEHLIGYEDGETNEQYDECTIWVNDIFDVNSDGMDEIERMFLGNGNANICPCASPKDLLKGIVAMLNQARELYLETKDKRFWWQMIQLLPSSYNQKRTVMLNYEVLANIYPARKAHKLDDWRAFCKWIESLPESWIITGEEEDTKL